MCNSSKICQGTGVVVAGGGAAGLFCAWILSRANQAPLLLEAAPAPGRKLAASGGGFANFSHMPMRAARFLCQPEPEFCKPALAAFTPEDMLVILENWHLPVTGRSDGRLFLNVPARRLVSAMTADIINYGGSIRLNEPLAQAAPQEGGFRLATGGGQLFCRNLVLALGSPAHPSLAGARLKPDRLCPGHDFLPFKPALMPLYYGKATPEAEKFKKLAGIAITCLVSLDAERSWLGRLLFTHRGLSGPAVLSASLYWRPGMPLAVNFLPGQDFAQALDLEANRRATPLSLLRRRLPDRLAKTLLPEELADTHAARLSRASRKHLAAAVHAREFAGLEASGLGQAETCSGGAATSQINAASMESRLWSGLFLIGEMVAVTGELGGYNLHWAWASGHAAASAIIESQRQ